MRLSGLSLRWVGSQLGRQSPAEVASQSPSWDQEKCEPMENSPVGSQARVEERAGARVPRGSALFNPERMN